MTVKLVVMRPLLKEHKIDISRKVARISFILWYNTRANRKLSIVKQEELSMCSDNEVNTNIHPIFLLISTIRHTILIEALSFRIS